MKERIRKTKFLRRLDLLIIQVVGVFANPTADTQDHGDDITNVDPIAEALQTSENSNEETEIRCSSSPNNDMSPLKRKQMMTTYKDFEYRKEDEKLKSVRDDDTLLSEKSIGLKSFGCPGPPITNLMDDFEELTLESRETLPSTRLDFNRDVRIGTERTSPASSGIPSMSTLSQDDMTLDAEMGRPPMITAAGRTLQRQQQERQNRDGQEEKQRLRLPEELSMDRRNVSNDSDRRNVSNDTDRRNVSNDSDRRNVSNDSSLHNQKEKVISPEKNDEGDIIDFIKELAKTMNKPTPTIKLFDAAILYDKNDYEDAKGFMEEVQLIANKELQEDIRIELFDSEEFVQSKVMVVADVVERCSVVFMYITNNSNTDFFNFFCDEAVGMSRLGLYNPVNPTGFQMKDRRWMLKPVHTQSVKNRYYKTPVGLLTLNGVEWYDWPKAYVRDKLRSILRVAINRRKQAESTRNIELTYNHVFSKEGQNLQPLPRASSVPQFRPPGIPGSSSQSIDAFSHPYDQSHRNFQHNLITPSHIDMPPQGPYLPDHHLPYVNYAQQPFPRNDFRPNPQYFDPGQLPSHHNVNMNFQRAPNTYQSQMPVPPIQPGLGYANYGPPPPYQPSVMQDELSYMYPTNSQHIFGPHGYPIGPRRLSQASQVPPSTPKTYVEHQVGARSDHVHRSQNTYQQYNGQSRQTDASQNGSVRHYGAAFGSLMRDQKDDTPPSHELNVVSRLTGKLITNSNLSNDDLEVDIGEKKGKVLETNSFKESENEDATNSSEDSDSDSNDDADDLDIGKLFPDKGRVLNIIGSGVVQLGKHNKTVERYKTKRVYQGIPKRKSGSKANKKEKAGDINSDAKKRDSDQVGIIKRGEEDSDRVKDTAARHVDRLSDRDAINLRPDLNHESRNLLSSEQSMKTCQSKPVEDMQSFPLSNFGDRLNTGIQPYVTENHINDYVLVQDDHRSAILLNNLDQERNLSLSCNDVSKAKIYAIDDPNPQLGKHEPTSSTDDFRLSCIESIPAHKMTSQRQEMDDTELFTSIDDNTFELGNIEIPNDDELFVASGSVVQHEQARFLFSSFRTSPFSKPSSIASDANTDNINDEQDDLD